MSLFYAIEITLDPEAKSAPDLAFVDYVPLSCEKLTIGSIPYANIFLPSPQVSRRHAQISVHADSIHICDLESSNGTWINGSRLTPNINATIRLHDSILIRPFILKIIESQPERDQTITETAFLDHKKLSGTELLQNKFIAEVLKSYESDLSCPHFECKFKGETQSGWLLSEPGKVYTIGRHDSCDLVLPLPNISRRHASIIRDWEDKVLIRDEHSVNGVRINGIPISEACQLFDKDVVEIGDAVLTFHIRDVGNQALNESESEANPSKTEPNRQADTSNILPELKHKRFSLEMLFVISGIVMIVIALTLAFIIFNN